MSRPGITAYHRPASLEEAWNHISGGDHSVRVLSGGTDLTISAPAEVTTLVDLAEAVDGAIGSEEDGSIRIGAMVTLTEMLESPILARYATGVLPEMLADVGNPLLRNISSLGGHVARGKLSDVVPVLVALDAQIGIFRGGGERLPIARYYEEKTHHTPHLVSELILPPLPKRSATAFLRFSRTAFDFPILNVCCRVNLDGPMVNEVRIVCGATPHLAKRATGAEAWIREHGLHKRSITTAARRAHEEIPTRSGWVASAEYRSHLVEVLTERCLQEVARRLGVS